MIYRLIDMWTQRTENLKFGSCIRTGAYKSGLRL